jgi:hypothetical protein
MPSKIVSTPLEILGRWSSGRGFGGGLATVSTLLEILAECDILQCLFDFISKFQPFLRFWRAEDLPKLRPPPPEAVSTLLEILGLVCLVVVGF